MDLVKVLSQLRQELAHLDAAISSLELLQRGGETQRRGRPPKASSDVRRSAGAESGGPIDREDAAL